MNENLENRSMSLRDEALQINRPSNGAKIMPKPQEPEWEGGGGWWFPVCPECHGIISEYAETCPHCQTPLNWKGEKHG